METAADPTPDAVGEAVVKQNGTRNKTDDIGYDDDDDDDKDDEGNINDDYNNKEAADLTGSYFLMTKSTSPFCGQHVKIDVDVAKDATNQ